MRVFCLLALLLAVCPVFAKDGHHWKRGTVVGIVDVGSSHHSSIVKYQIDDGSKIYEGRIIYTGRRIGGIRVHGAIEYDVDKGHLYLRDSHGKAHTLVLVRENASR